jgi:hypothetical protein
MVQSRRPLPANLGKARPTRRGSSDGSGVTGVEQVWSSRGQCRPTRCNARMNRRDVRALGWVVTGDACSEIARVALGSRRRMSLAALRELGGRWRAVHASPTADHPEPLGALLIGQLTNSLSREHEKTAVEFVDSLRACCPDLYSERALRNRCLSSCGQAIVSLAFGVILAHWTSSDIPIVGDAALVMFVIACWSLVTTIQLWRTHRLVKRISEFRRLRRPVTHGSSAQPEDDPLTRATATPATTGRPPTEDDRTL